MAVIRESAAIGGSSGTLGNVVFAQTPWGTVMRSRPERARRRSEAQVAQSQRLAWARVGWNALSAEEVQAWRDYSLRQAERNPRTGALRVPSAYSVFTGLGSKYLQVHGGSSVPTSPPEGRFLGDVLDLTVEARPNALRFTSATANRPGALTEILIQRLTGPHNATRPKSYVNLAFVAMEAATPVELPLGAAGYWAYAVRYVEAATGRMTAPVELGRAFVPGA